MSSALDVAQYLLNIAEEKQRKMNPMQLLKMTYICYGYYSVENNGQLFTDSIEAWRYGPVIPNLYRKIKKYGQGSVNKKIGGDVSTLSDIKKEWIEAVYEAYKDFSALRLSAITHLEGTPWSKVHIEDLNMQITDDFIRPYYKELYENPESVH